MPGSQKPSVKTVRRSGKAEPATAVGPSSHQRDARHTNARRNFRLRWEYVVLAAFLVLFAVKFIQKTEVIQALNKQKAALDYQNQALRQDDVRVQHAIGYYRTTQYVQEEARAVFGYTQPGDVAIMSKPQDPRVVAVRAAPPRPAPPPEPTWKQWWQAFASP